MAAGSFRPASLGFGGLPLRRKISGFAFMVLVLAGTAALAREKPRIVRHEASYLDQMVVIILQWQSPNPVVRITAFVGNRKQEVKVDEYDNRRNQDGYWGEVTVEVPAAPSATPDAIPYILQVEDDLRQKSERISGRARVAAASPPERADDGWGRQHLEGTGVPGQTRTGGQPVPPGGGQYPPYGEGQYPPNSEGQYPPYGEGQYPPNGTGPTIQLIDVSVYGGQVRFTFQAFDETGLRKITYRVFDVSGSVVQERQIPSQGQEFTGPTEALPLAPGTYRVTVQAVGASGNASPEETRDFIVDESGSGAQPDGSIPGESGGAWDHQQGEAGGESGAGEYVGETIDPEVREGAEGASQEGMEWPGDGDPRNEGTSPPRVEGRP